MTRFIGLLLPAVLRADEVCMSKFLDSELQDKCDDGFKSISRMKNWIELINCPLGEESGGACAGGASPWSKQGVYATYTRALQTVIKDYGCNCFPSSKKILNDRNNLVAVPGTTGAPIDKLDMACTTLARRHTCTKMELGHENTGLEYDWSNGSNDCGYYKSYKTWFNPETEEYECGTEENPGYNNIFEIQSDQNKNDCIKRLCEMDREFAMEIADLMIDPFQFWVDNQDNYYINDSDMCNWSEQQNEHKLDQCCGFEEARTPFSSHDKRCCNDEIVKKNSMEEEMFCMD